MSAAKPKGPTPSLIGGSNGRPKRANVLRLSECCRCHHQMTKGQTCIEIPKLGSAFTASKRYCNECYGKILEKTKEDIVALSTL